MNFGQDAPQGAGERFTATEGAQIVSTRPGHLPRPELLAPPSAPEEAGRGLFISPSLTARFHSKYEIVEPGGCWVWMGGVDRQGYGKIVIGGRQVGAHRLSWELHCGPIPDGACVLHRCDVPSCVNPAHLFLGDRAANMADCRKKGRARGGRLCGEAHGRAKLSTAQVVEIRRLAGSLSRRLIAERFGMSVQQIGFIIRGDRWAHVPIIPEGGRRWSALSAASALPGAMPPAVAGRGSSLRTGPAFASAASGRLFERCEG